MLEVTNIRVSYGLADVLKDVSISVKEKEIVTIIGSNAAGKSTLLKTISGLLKPLCGTIVFNSVNIERLPPHKIAKLGISFAQEGKRVFPSLTVAENLKMGAYLHNEKEQFNRSIEVVFNLFPRLKERAKQKAGTLSGGERQMLVLAMCLMSCPKLLMLDEPSHGLAPNLVTDIFNSILRIRDEQNVTILLVEQNVSESLMMADRGYVLENGRIVLEGKASELKESPKIKKAYLGL